MILLVAVVFGSGVFAFFFCFVLSSRIRRIDNRLDDFERGKRAEQDVAAELAEFRRRLIRVELAQAAQQPAPEAVGRAKPSEEEGADEDEGFSEIEQRLERVEKASAEQEEADRVDSVEPAGDRPPPQARDIGPLHVPSLADEPDHVPADPRPLRAEPEPRLVEPAPPADEAEPVPAEPASEPVGPGTVLVPSAPSAGKTGFRRPETELPPSREPVPPRTGSPTPTSPRAPSDMPGRLPPLARLAAHSLGARIGRLLVPAVNLLKTWATTGNVPVKAGVLLSLLGLAFLLRVAVERGIIVLTIEMGLVAATLFGVALLVLGWRVHGRRPLYGLSLQGGGIAVLYLTTYVAYAIAGVTPVLVASASVVAITVGSGVLAVVQDSRSLAVLGMIGGFLAPILAYSNAEDHVLVFGFYTILSAAIVAVAWFKIWPELNLLGLGFTLGLTTFWLLERYRQEDWATTQPLIAILVLLYMTIPLLFAVRRRPDVKGLMTSPFVFGVPFAALAIQFYLTPDNIPDLPAYSALALAVILGAFALVARRYGNQWQTLEEVYYALAATFAAIAVPLALDTQYITIVWTLQGTMLVLIGIRHARRLYQWGGPLLQLLGIVAFLVYFEDRMSITGQIDTNILPLFLVDSFDYRLAITSLTLAIVYTVSPELLRRIGRAGDEWKIAKETYLTIGMALVALTVLVSFETEYVALLLAIQGVLLVWLGVHSLRQSPLLVGFILQALGVAYFGAYLVDSLPSTAQKISGWAWSALLVRIIDGPILFALFLALGYTVFSILLRRWGVASEESRILEEVYLLIGMGFLVVSVILTFENEWMSLFLAL